MPEKPYVYNRFIGLDTIADRRQMGERFLEICEHAFVDLRGQINKIPGHKLRSDSTHPETMYCQHYGDGVIISGWNNAGGIILRAHPSGAEATTLWPWGSQLDFVQFLNKVHVLPNTGTLPLSWDGTTFAGESAFGAVPGACGANVLSRIVVADYPASTTEFAVSKAGVLDFTVAGLGAADDAARINIIDDLTGVDRIMGLGTFEGNKLAIFCKNETLLYVADPDIKNWTLLRDFRVPIGTIGKRTIKRVGNDLFFASKFGVHSIRRAINGVTLESITFSRVVQDIYATCMAQLHSTLSPRAVWDPDKGHYHLFIPQGTGLSAPTMWWSRFTFTIEPAGKQPHLSWGFTPNPGWADGSYFNGEMVIAVPSVGLCNDDMTHETDTSALRVRTAMLYQGNPAKQKTYKRLLIRASGDAKFTVNAYDDNRELLDSFDLSNYPMVSTPPFYTPERPLDLPFEHNAYGIQLEFVSQDKGDLRIMDFAVTAE